LINAIPVTNPATVTDGLQFIATLPLSKKKKAVAANMPIDIIQNEIPTKSSVARIVVAALAADVNPITAVKTIAKIFNLLMKSPTYLVFLFINLNLHYSILLFN
jgi:hypothetical protein